MSRHVAGGAALALAGALLLAPPASAETFKTCTGVITSLPAVIATQGIWCLTGDLTTSISTGEAILVDTNNVTIDCNGYRIGGLAAGIGTQAHGIDGDGRTNVTVRGCNIRGFYRGVVLTGTSAANQVIEDNRFDGNTLSAILIAGEGMLVQRNRIFDTGPSTVTAMAVAIYSQGPADIIDNTVSGVVAATGGDGSVTGILAYDNTDGQVADNRIRGLDADGAGHANGIRATIADRVSIRGNDLVGDGTATGVGVTCSGVNPVSRDNAVSHFGSGILAACNDHSGNVVKP